MEQGNNEVLARIQLLEERLAKIEKILQEGLYNPFSQKAGSVQKPRPTLPPKQSPPAFNSGSALEAKIGGTVLNRIAIVAILIGISFFLKYAFDHQWIGPTGRIVIGIICGVALLGGGEYFQQKKYPVFAQGLSGGGIAVLYFSIFAAFQFYNLIPQVVAFLIMILITAVAVTLSLRYSSQAIAVFGIVGGFCTPFLLSNGSANYIVLFSYNILLNLAILSIAYFKDWKILNYLSFILTYLTFVVGRVATQGGEPDVWISEAFLTGFFIIYSLLAVFYHVLSKRKSNQLDFALNLLNAALYFGLSYYLLLDKIKDFMGFYAAAVAAYYLLLGYLAWKRRREDQFTALSFWGLTLAFTTIAVPLQLDGTWVSLGWTVEAVFLLWLGFRMGHFFTRIFGVAVIGLVGWNLLYREQGVFPSLGGYSYVPNDTFPFLNWTSLEYLALTTACFAAAWLYHRYPTKGPDDAAAFSLLGLLAANIILVIWLSKETIYTFDYLFSKGQISAWIMANVSRLSLSAVWALYSIVLLVLGIIKRNQPLRLMAIVLFGFTIFKVFLYDLSNLDTLYRIFSFVGLGIILLAASFLYQKYKSVILGLVVEEKQEGVNQ